jgi:cyclic pyranopterin phosphate synthase
LHGHYPEIHDKLTRTPGSFEQTVKGIKNLLDLGYDPGRIVVNTVITKQNMQYLENIADFVLNDLKLPRTKFSFMEIEGNALKNMKELLPRFRETYPFLEKAAELAGKSGKKIIIEKGPLCFCPDIPNVSYVFERVLIDTKRFIKPESCSACPSNGKCHGIHGNYVKLYPLDELENRKTNKLKIIFRG